MHPRFDSCWLILRRGAAPHALILMAFMIFSAVVFRFLFRDRGISRHVDVPGPWPEVPAGTCWPGWAGWAWCRPAVRSGLIPPTCAGADSRLEPAEAGRGGRAGGAFGAVPHWLG